MHWSNAFMSTDDYPRTIHRCLTRKRPIHEQTKQRAYCQIKTNFPWTQKKAVIPRIESLLSFRTINWRASFLPGAGWVWLISYGDKNLSELCINVLERGNLFGLWNSYSIGPLHDTLNGGPTKGVWVIDWKREAQGKWILVALEFVLLSSCI